MRVLAAHALRYLEQAGKDVDTALDEAAGAAALVAAGLAWDRAALGVPRPDAPVPPEPPEGGRPRPPCRVTVSRLSGALIPELRSLGPPLVGGLLFSCAALPGACWGRIMSAGSTFSPYCLSMTFRRSRSRRRWPGR